MSGDCQNWLVFAVLEIERMIDFSDIYETRSYSLLNLDIFEEIVI
jgi:hypothetical protein